MCRVDDSDGRVVVLSDARLVARKPHRCKECRRTIAAGETYRREGCVFDGERFTHKTCSQCDVLRAWLMSNCGGLVYGEVLEEVDEHGYNCDRRDLSALVRLARNGWRWAGKAVLVPARPPLIGEPIDKRRALGSAAGRE